MREWLSGGAPPCQGGGRGFDPRLALLFLRFYRAVALVRQPFLFNSAFIDFLGGLRAVAFIEITLSRLKARVTANQSSWLKTALHDCPGEMEGSSFCKNHLLSTAGKNLT